MLRTAWPQLVNKLHGLLDQTVGWASGFFNLSAQKINAEISEATGELMKTATQP